MNDTRHGLVGPILLIVVGVVLLLTQLGLWALDWTDLLRLWPLLLILVGLDIVLGHTRAGGAMLLLTGVVIVALAVLWIAPPVTGRPADDQVSYSHPAAGVESATVRLEVGAAELDVRPLYDSQNLFQAEVEYNERRTRVDYQAETRNSQAAIILQSETTQGVWLPVLQRLSEQWRVGLSPDVPLDLEVTAGVSTANLDLHNLRLTELQLNAGVGDVHVRLPGRGDYRVSVDGGVGALTIEIPAEIDARIRVDGGVGSVDIARRFERQGRYYISEGYASAEQKVDIDIDGGLGSVTVR